MDAAASTHGRRGLTAFYVLLVSFLYAPIAVLMVFSFNDNRLIAFPLVGFTTRWYRLLLENQELIDALKASVIVAAISSVLAVALGVLASYAIVRRRFRGKAAASSLLLSPLVIPYVVFGIALLILFQAVDEFLIPRLGVYFGLGIHSIVIGHVVVSLPFTILVIALDSSA